MTVPATWIKAIRRPRPAGEISSCSPKNNYVKVTHCFWPNKGSDDEKKVGRLIKECSEPDEGKWVCLDGSLKGFFNSMKEAEAYITEKLGTESTENDVDRLLAVGDKAARPAEEKERKGNKTKGSKTPSALSCAATTSSSTPTSVKQTSSTPSTSGIYVHFCRIEIIRHVVSQNFR